MDEKTRPYCYQMSSVGTGGDSCGIGLPRAQCRAATWAQRRTKARPTLSSGSSSLNKSLMEVSQHCGWNLPLLQITGSLLCVAVSISAFFELISFSGRSRSLTSVLNTTGSRSLLCPLPHLHTLQLQFTAFLRKLFMASLGKRTSGALLPIKMFSVT